MMISSTPTHDNDNARCTVWGLDPLQLHDRFWAARGVQVVRQGEPSEIVADAELFLLTDPRSLVIFPLRELIDAISWLNPRVMLIRLQNRVEHGYRELVISDENDHFINVKREYAGNDTRLARVGLTPDSEIARQWQSATSPNEGWKQLRTRINKIDRTTVPQAGFVYDRTVPEELMQLMYYLIQAWKYPDSTINRVSRHSHSVWADQDAKIHSQTRFIGSAWVGSGRTLAGDQNVVGPVVLWDDPAKRPVVSDLQWQEIEPSDPFNKPARPRQFTSLERFLKRTTDVFLSLFTLALTLPFYPLIMLAIWIEDGRPFFFVQERESIAAKPFPCIKFRSMRRDAEKIRSNILKQNQADGPQFFILNDPRHTRAGRFIRKYNIDELPQFFNVLLGQMSLVGPRPLARKENQCCPPWRESRLSVRPGLTGLWQVERSRQQGLDFQEWIRYDIEYVRRANWRLDAWIIWKTIKLMIFHTGA